MDKFNDGIIDLSQFRKKKEEQEALVEPIFTEPTIITLGNPEDEQEQMQYLLLVNLVVNNKQFLALESMQKEDRGQVAIVEAIVQDGQFSGVQVVESEEEFEEVMGIMTEALNASSQETEGELNDNDSTH